MTISVTPGPNRNLQAASSTSTTNPAIITSTTPTATTGSTVGGPAAIAAAPAGSTVGSGPRLETLEADFGLGKGEAAIDPAVVLGSETGNGFAIVGAVVTITDQVTDVTVTCTIAASGKCLAANDAQYDLLDPSPISGDHQPTVPGTFFYDSRNAITITQTVVPTGFRAYPGVATSLTVPACSQTIGTFPTSCQALASTVTFYNGYLVSLGLLKTNQKTGSAVSGATYQLCATAAAPPIITTTSTSTSTSSSTSLSISAVGRNAAAAAATCPAGSTAAGSATSGANGKLVFPGLFDPDASYRAIEVSAPAGFVLDSAPTPLVFVPPASFAAVGVTQFTAVADSPIPVVISTSTVSSPTTTTLPSTTVSSTTTLSSTTTTATTSSVAAVVTTTTTTSPQLASTGVAAVGQLVLAAFGFLAAGLVVLVVGRRRGRTPRQH